MNPVDIKAVVVQWALLGFETISTRDGKQVWNDGCVLESMHGSPTLPSDWLTLDSERRIAYLPGTEPGVVIGRGQL